jgi:hypothetical protein
VGQDGRLIPYEGQPQPVDQDAKVARCYVRVGFGPEQLDQVVAPALAIASSYKELEECLNPLLPVAGTERCPVSLHFERTEHQSLVARGG